jgi:diaminohydroxyphosphoribosylaminopyrimidine deaminase/5-amino-6-(5-phosphoribosylamino)uracil reductase
MVDFDSFFMEIALNEAWKYQLLTYPNPSVGCVIAKNNKLISYAAHKEAGKPHAEIEAIVSAFVALSGNKEIEKGSLTEVYSFLYNNCRNFFKGYTIYITLEPCMHYGKTPPCAPLIKQLGFERVVVGIKDENPVAKGGVEYLRDICAVKVGVKKEECKKLIEPYLKWRRKRFVFFKLAQSLNGKIAPGTISSYNSRKFVHLLRTKIDLLVIGGRSVRADKPILDARYVDRSGSNVLVYSKKGVSKNLPLFKVKGRSVFVENSLEKIEKSNFVMIEGGGNMLESVKNMVDWFLIFQSSKMMRAIGYNAAIETEILKSFLLGEDLIIWARKAKDEL